MKTAIPTRELISLDVDGAAIRGTYHRPPGAADKDVRRMSGGVVAGIDDDVAACQCGFEPFARGQVHPVLRSAAAQCPHVMPAPAEFRKDQAAQRPGPANDRCLHTLVTTQPAAV